jgi:hypothetical protein
MPLQVECTEVTIKINSFDEALGLDMGQCQLRGPHQFIDVLFFVKDGQLMVEQPSPVLLTAHHSLSPAHLA